MLRLIAMLLLASSSVAAATQAGFHVGVRVVSSATVAANPAAERDRILVQVASHGAQAPLVMVGGAAGWASSGKVKFEASSNDEVVVTFLY